MISAQEALDRLREGNRRFVSDARDSEALTGEARRSELAAGQAPFAVVLGCSDSRVPAEVVFDQGLGDLFVIRVAGNLVAPHQTGSIEFSVAQFGTPLVVVLGHSRCGGVLSTLQALQQPGDDLSPNLRAIVDGVRPSVEALLATELKDDPDVLVERAVQANVRASVRQIRQESDMLDRLIRNGELRVVGAVYSLETGVVEFLDSDRP